MSRTRRRFAAGVGTVLALSGALPPGAGASGLRPAPAIGVAASTPAVLRCGWFDNPSPSNATLTDRDGEWIVAQQGGHQSEGPWPKFTPGSWVRSGRGSHGHGCACLRVRADRDSGEVAAVVEAHARPLTACRRDPALRNKEPDRTRR